MKSTLRRVHRWLALGLAVFWLSQALTGLVMVYRWEIDDAAIDAPAAALDPAAFAARIAAIEATPGAGATVTSLYATGGVPGRFDLYVDAADGSSSVVRVDGRGHVLRERPGDSGFITTTANLHQTLLAGDRGRTVVGIVGMGLLVAIVLGLVLAWPARASQWPAVLWPRGARPGPARRYAWHRAIGLWLGLPALVLAAAGVLLAFESRVAAVSGTDGMPAELAAEVDRVASADAAAAVPQPTLDAAITAALAQFPDAELSGVSMPGTGKPWYRIRVRQPDELRRVYGTSVVYVAATDGRVLRVEDALHAPPARAFMDALYPVHTGEAFGGAGRVLALAVGLWLMATLTLGLGLWSARRSSRK